MYRGVNRSSGEGEKEEDGTPCRLMLLASLGRDGDEGEAVEFAGVRGAPGGRRRRRGGAPGTPLLGVVDGEEEGVCGGRVSGAGLARGRRCPWRGAQLSTAMVARCGGDAERGETNLAATDKN
jgi:hypothetical protein